MLDELGQDHRSWLLVAAHNYLSQQKAEPAIVLLELLDALDPDNAQAQKMLAYAFWMVDEHRRCATALKRVERLPLSSDDEAAMALLRGRLGDEG